jgi:adenylate cyclase
VANESNDSGDTQATARDLAGRTVPTASVSFWTRIKDHKVVQWTLGYVAAAYAALDGLRFVSETFDWPNQLVRILTILLILGLPLVVTLAWFHGHKALHRVGRSEFTIITVLLAIGAGVLWHLARTPQEAAGATTVRVTPAPQHPVASVPAKGTIAVLPFVDMSEKHDQEYFSDGLSEELIDHLAHYPDLKVIARTSSFAFKGKNEDMRSIATKLGVANLLEGSVRKSRGELRITAQLIRALDGVHLWSEIYDRKLIDIFKVQDEISTTVARALNATLNGSDTTSAQSKAKGTTSIEAYNLYLQGDYTWWRSYSGDNVKAVELLKQALKVDPRYAGAWARLARIYAYQGQVGEITVVDAEVRGQDAVQQALVIDPNCAEAYYARGNIYWQVVGDWAAGITAFEKATALDPNGDIGERARRNMQVLKGMMSGDFSAAIDSQLRFLERNPLDTESMNDLAAYQQFAGLLNESAATSRKLLALSPTYSTAQAQYGVTLLLLGQTAAALAATMKESDSLSNLQALACVYWGLGRRTDSESVLHALEKGYADRNAYEIATVHAYRGELDAAFGWLDRAFRQHKAALATLRVDPLLHNLHGDRRFDALLRKVKVAE